MKWIVRVEGCVSEMEGSRDPVFVESEENGRSLLWGLDSTPVLPHAAR